MPPPLAPSSGKESKRKARNGDRRNAKGVERETEGPKAGNSSSSDGDVATAASSSSTGHHSGGLPNVVACIKAESPAPKTPRADTPVARTKARASATRLAHPENSGRDHEMGRLDFRELRRKAAAFPSPPTRPDAVCGSQPASRDLFSCPKTSASTQPKDCSTYASYGSGPSWPDSTAQMSGECRLVMGSLVNEEDSKVVLGLTEEQLEAAIYLRRYHLLPEISPLGSVRLYNISDPNFQLSSQQISNIRAKNEVRKSLVKWTDSGTVYAADGSNDVGDLNSLLGAAATGSESGTEASGTVGSSGSYASSSRSNGSSSLSSSGSGSLSSGACSNGSSTSCSASGRLKPQIPPSANPSLPSDAKSGDTQRSSSQSSATRAATSSSTATQLPSSLSPSAQASTQSIKPALQPSLPTPASQPSVPTPSSSSSTQGPGTRSSASQASASGSDNAAN